MCVVFMYFRARLKARRRPVQFKAFLYFRIEDVEAYRSNRFVIVKIRRNRSLATEHQVNMFEMLSYQSPLLEAIDLLKLEGIEVCLQSNKYV